MSEKIFIGVAWPYADGHLHLGRAVGAYLPSDIFARYHRTKGNEVLMVSGTDEHGTPITIRAEQEKKSPAELARFYHDEYVEDFRRFGIASFNLFTGTSTKNHQKVSQEIFLNLLEKGHIFKQTVLQAYCPSCRRFLTDRYVEGVCPFCASPRARGDQCEECGKPLDAVQLKSARCRLCGASPEFRESEHFFLRLSAFGERLREWMKDKTWWRPDVYNTTMHYLDEGLKDRAITRDIEWGIPVPLPGFEGKCLYVWFEAVIGYYSASIEWAAGTDNPERWRDFWHGGNKSYYFIGKDNIFFHTIIWPAMLMGYDEKLNLPYDVPANEFLTLEGRKFSTSRNWAVWLPDYLARYEPDPLRYYLSANMPETSDADFSWSEFVRRNNNELVATYGNLVHRVLTFTCRNYDNKIPEPGVLDERSKGLITLSEKTLAEMDTLLYSCHFRDAVRAGMTLAQEANRYLDEKAPWKAIKQDRAAAGASLYTAICAISALRTAMYPFLPFSSEKLNGYLGGSAPVEKLGWRLTMPEPGQKLETPQPLFIKLDEKVVEEETTRLGTG